MTQLVVAQENYSRIEINYDKSIISELAELGIPLDDAIIQKNSIIIELSDSDIQNVFEAGINYEILISDISAYYLENNSKGEILRTEKTPDNFNLGSMGGNLTLSQMLTELDDMQALFPDLISIKQEITTDYTTHNGNYVYWVKISDNPDVDEEDEPEVLYTSLHHAREPVSMMQLVYMMWYLLENYEEGTESEYLIDNFEMYFVLCQNQDGYLYNESTNSNGGGMWRKNRRNNGDGNYGVDPNRNYPYMWGYDNSGSSQYTSEQTYRGPSAGSEPITQMMIEFVEAHDFLICDNHHSYSDLLLYSWAYEEIHSADNETFATYAQIMTRENNYATGQPWEILYAVNGDSNDWMYGEHDILAFTSETGNSSQGFWPAQSDIIPLCEGNMEMNLFLTRLSGAYAEVQDKSSNFIKRSGYLDFNISFFGLDTTANFQVYYSGDNILLSDTMSFSDYSLLEIQADSLFYIVSEDVTYGQEFTFTLNIDNGNYVYQQELTKTIQKSEIYFDDNGNNLTNWSSNDWNTTSNDFHSPNKSITDSPNGNYSSSATNPITSTNIDLSSIENANLSFWAKWNIENNWDYVQFYISTNGGSSWTELEGNYTNSGTGSFQPTGEPLYDGTSNWVNEQISLNDYLVDDVVFKFVLFSDGDTEKDGFYFDDFIITGSTNNIKPVITGQNTIDMVGNQKNTINLSDLIVEDADNIYPNDFFIIAYEGDNYSLSEMPNIIIPEADYSGSLTIPVSVSDGYEMSEPFDLDVNTVASVNSVNNFNFELYPNPTSDYVNIVADSRKFNEINIVDITGKILLTKAFNADVVQVSVMDFDPGIYFVQLKGQYITMQKIVIVE